MRINNFFKLIIAIVVSEAAGIIGSFFTISAIPTWYAGLVKPALNPPSWVFGPAWTVNPLQALHVVGQCVTGDTRLRRRRRRRQLAFGNGLLDEDTQLAFGSWQLANSQQPIANGQHPTANDYFYDEVPIKDIQAGDEIASLDEATGKIVWSKVNALMDMGVKTTYRLRTEDGREIRTTENHPYLTRHGWVKVSSLRKGVEIATADERLFAGTIAETRICDNCNRKNHNGNSKIKELHDDNNNYAFTSLFIKKPTTHALNMPINPRTNAAKLNSADVRYGITRDARDTSPMTTRTSDRNLSWELEGIYRHDTIQNADVNFSKIASIEKVGEEQVYDIEVEGTHNFIGNDIVAHNTYITND